MQISGKLGQNSRQKLSKKCGLFWNCGEKTKLGFRRFWKTMGFSEVLPNTLKSFYPYKKSRFNLLMKSFPSFAHSSITITTIYNIKLI